MTEKHEYEQVLAGHHDRLTESADSLAQDPRSPLQLIGRTELACETGAAEPVELREQTTDRMTRRIDDRLKIATHGDVVTDPGS